MEFFISFPVNKQRLRGAVLHFASLPYITKTRYKITRRKREENSNESLQLYNNSKHICTGEKSHKKYVFTYPSPFFLLFLQRVSARLKSTDFLYVNVILSHLVGVCELTVFEQRYLSFYAQ